MNQQMKDLKKLLTSTEKLKKIRLRKEAEALSPVRIAITIPPEKWNPKK